MALDQKIRSLYAGHLFRPKSHELEDEEVIYVLDMPFEFESIALRWLESHPGRLREGPRGIAMTVMGWDDLVRWMISQLRHAVYQLPINAR